MFKFIKILNSCDGKFNNSLDVRLTKACDNDCSFCIEKDGLDSLGKTDVPALIQSTLASKKESILILGGEPFLKVSELKSYILGIRPHVKEIFITTSIPRTLDPNNPEVVEILNAIDGLNISLQHYLPSVNNEALRASDRFDRIERLEQLLKDPAVAEKTRVSINLSALFIDSKVKLERFIWKMECINCQHIKINELQEVESKLYVSFEEIYGVKLKSPYAFGCQTDISELFEHRMKVTLKRACFKVMDPTLAQNRVSIWDVLKLIHRKFKPTQSEALVLYENGDLSNGWCKK